MWLTDLEPQFYGRIGKVWPKVPYIADAVGVQFLCPKCYARTAGRSGRTPSCAGAWLTVKGAWAVGATAPALSISRCATPPGLTR